MHTAGTRRSPACHTTLLCKDVNTKNISPRYCLLSELTAPSITAGSTGTSLTSPPADRDPDMSLRGRTRTACGAARSYQQKESSEEPRYCPS